MKREVTLEAAAAGLFHLVQDLRGGDEVLITSEGKPVARLTPVPPANVAEDREKAVASMIELMQRGWPIGAGPLDRDEVHER